MKITENQYLQVVGLIALAAKVNRDGNRLRDAAVELLSGADKDAVGTLIWEAGFGGPWDASENPKKHLADMGVEVVADG